MGSAEAVDLLTQAELFAECPQGSDGPEASGSGGQGPALTLFGGDQILKLAEVDLLEAARLTVDTAAADRVEVAMTLDELLFEVRLF